MTYITDHKSNPSLLTFILVKVHTATPQCMTDCDIPLTYNGDTYTPTAGLKTGGIQSSQTDRAAVSANIEIGNCNDFWGALMSSLSSTARHPTVQVFQAWLNPATPFAGPAEVRGLLVGSVESHSIVPEGVELTIGPPVDERAATLPWRRMTTRCDIRRFKGLQCKYAGAATSCDRSYATCTTLANTANFGGWRLIPDTDPVTISVHTHPVGGVYPVVNITIGKEE